MLLRPRLQPQLLELLLLLLLLLLLVMLLVMVTAHLRNVLSAAVYLPSRRHVKVSYRAIHPPCTHSFRICTHPHHSYFTLLSCSLVIVNVHVYSQRLQKYTKSSRTQNVGLKSHAYTKHRVN